MPVNRGRCLETIGDVDTNPVAFHRFDRGAVHAAVVAPALCFQAGRKLVVDFFGDEVINLHPVNDLPRQRGAAGSHDRGVGLSPHRGGSDT